MVEEAAGTVGVVGAVCCVVDGGPEVHAAGESFLIRRHDADALVQERRVRVGNILAAGVVDEDAFVGEFGEEFEGLVDGQRRGGGFFEVGFPCLEGERGGAVGGAEAFAGPGDEDEGDVWEFLTEDRELGEEVAAYTAGSWELVRLSKRVARLILERDKQRWMYEFVKNMAR